MQFNRRGPFLFFLGWGIYIGGGVFLSKLAKGTEEAPPAAAAVAPPTQNVSRAALLDALFTIQGALEGQKQHHAFLSVDVAGSSAMKRGEPELAVEYSFLQLQSWLEETVAAYGGELHSAAGDGMMCVFTSDAAALRAAKALQAGVPQFNTERSRLSQPFRLRCGISAGEVALDRTMPFSRQHSPIIDRAANLQKAAEPGDIVVAGELAAAGLVELGGLAPLPEPVHNEPVFSWRAAQRQSRV
jgi:class 3 adenylate cyclase